ncbi:hypothetical protein ACJX0J_034554, partial [Zea mays]
STGLCLSRVNRTAFRYAMRRLSFERSSIYGHGLCGIIMAKKYKKDGICDIGLIKSANTMS